MSAPPWPTWPHEIYVFFFPPNSPAPRLTAIIGNMGKQTPGPLGFPFSRRVPSVEKLQTAAKVTPERTKVVPANAKAMQQWRMRLKSTEIFRKTTFRLLSNHGDLRVNEECGIQLMITCMFFEGSIYDAFTYMNG